MSDEPSSVRIVIADQHPQARQDVRRGLEFDPDFHILGEASNAVHAIELVRQNQPDILLVDFPLSQDRQLKTWFATHDSPHVRIVVTMTELEKTQLVEAFRLGAHGVVLKPSSPRVLSRSMRSVMAGHCWLESESVGILVEALRESLAQGNGTKSPQDYGLTRREVDIITKIASGRSNKEVGEEFAISERTVKHHLTNIFGKVGVSSRLQLALFAVNQNFIAASKPALSFPPLQPDDEG